MRLERRRQEYYKMRVYLDAIKDMEKITVEMWQEMQVYNPGPYIPRDIWIAYLEGCALAEARVLLDKEEAA